MTCFLFIRSKKGKKCESMEPSPHPPPQPKGKEEREARRAPPGAAGTWCGQASDNVLGSGRQVGINRLHDLREETLGLGGQGSASCGVWVSGLGCRQSPSHPCSARVLGGDT